MINSVNLLQLVKKLPLQAQIELQDFAESLVEKYRPEHPIKATYLQMNLDRERITKSTGKQ